MPLTRFECPDGESIELAECLEQCRLRERCLPKTMLRSFARERPFIDKLSVTQLSNGTLLEFLRATTPYSTAPFNRSFPLIGTNMHSRMEENRSFGDLVEIPVQHNLFYGTADLLTPDEENPGYYVLLDYKTYGSYRAGKFLGKKSVDVPSGELYKRKTVRKGVTYWPGQEKPEEVFYFDRDESEQDSEAWQLNTYRVGLELLGYPISRMEICVTLRDAGAYTARAGFTRNIYMMTIRFIDDDLILERAERKQTAYRNALATGVMPEKCSDTETWDGVRCQSWCEVRHLCPYGGDNAVLTKGEE